MYRSVPGRTVPVFVRRIFVPPLWRALRDPDTLEPPNYREVPPVPLLVALDEYESAMRVAAIHAQLGLAVGAGGTEAALRAILAVCQEASVTVGGGAVTPRSGAAGVRDRGTWRGVMLGVEGGRP